MTYSRLHHKRLFCHHHWELIIFVQIQKKMPLLGPPSTSPPEGGGGTGLKTGVGNYIFWSEIGSGFGELGGTPPPRIPRSTPPPWASPPVN